ncbi:hypothetical protein GCM10009839_37620 [Catenulispora yoronensis]|uniref:Ferredoxin n=1 Tax=Catenulispora yoronensis TaxID=450799 RepID=A0ABP5FXC7_9ACTN
MAVENIQENTPENSQETSQETEKPAEDAVFRVRADRAKCCGAGMCTLNAPEVFDQDPDEGLVVLLDPDPLPEQHRAVRDAVRLCPSGALSVEQG